MSLVSAVRLQPVNFQGAAEKKEQTSDADKKTMKTSTKIVGTGLLALAAVGIYLATRGKKVKNISTLSEFKKHGKLIKGEAVLTGGEKFTGTLSHTSNNGKEVVLRYENGKLIESNISNTSHTFSGGRTKPVTIQKKYVYDANGELRKVDSVIQSTDDTLSKVVEFTKSKYNNRNIYTITTDKNKIKRIFTNEGGKGVDFIENDGTFTKYSKNGKIEFLYRNNNTFSFGPNQQFSPMSVTAGGKIDKLEFLDIEIPGVGKVDVSLSNKREAHYIDPNNDKELKLSEDAIQCVKEKCEDMVSKISQMVRTWHLGLGFEPPKMNNVFDNTSHWHFHKVEDLLSDLKFNQ